MRVIESSLVLSTTDLTKFVRCDHATFIDHGVQRRTLTPLARRSPSAMAELISDKGFDHEQKYVESLRAEGRTIETIQRPGWEIEALREADRETLEAMGRGADYIYQAAFFDGRWSGFADLLERVDRPSALGGWSYEVVDTKLARATKAHFVLQLCDYSSHLARLQGAVPEAMHLLLGTNERETFRVAEFEAYHRHVRSSLDDFIMRGSSPTPYPVEFCSLCEWSAHCFHHWTTVDHLSLVANMRRTQVKRLEASAISTLESLANTDTSQRIPRLAPPTLGALNHQARLQLQHRSTKQHTFELLPLEPGRGFNRLPLPSDGDVFIDVEGDPFVGNGLTYLFGAAWNDGAGHQYRRWWAHTGAEERQAFESLIDFLRGRKTSDPNAHVYHYGAIEVSTLKRLTGQYATREAELDDLLRRETFVDLSAVIRQGLRASHSAYGLKKIETFYFERKEDEVADAGGAVVAYERWLETNEAQLLDAIERYNEEDCVSILRMQKWLAEIRPDDAAWKEVQEPRELGEDRIAEEQRSDQLYQQLVLQGQQLLANLLYYHRREERPGYWRYFERLNMDEHQLLEDSECIGALTLADHIPPVVEKKSRIFEYRYPGQEHKFHPGDVPIDPATQKPAGTIVSIDDARGALTIKRGPTLFDKPQPSALMPKQPIDTEPMRVAVQRLAASVAEQGVTHTPYQAAADILMASPPRLREGILDGVSDSIRRLDASYLFVQGPPGSGKTYTGARAIVQLLRDGMRVGVTSNSHKAIHNLLDEVEAVAKHEGLTFRGLKKSGTGADAKFTSKLAVPMIEPCGDNDDCTDSTARLVAGTAWLFSDPDMDQSVDYLFVDEAGQVSLANALAVSTAAKNVVLLGDPLQLAQVSQGTHPQRSGISVLEHLLGDHATVPSNRGIFLEHTWRMHPDVCSFVSEVVYDSRLHAAEECARQAVTINGVPQTGLRFMPIQHDGNSQSSPEEAVAIAATIRAMLDGTFTDSRGTTRPLDPRDFLVVAAYNAQVRHLTAALEDVGLADVPIGTVDKFQGRQAAIVFFSMATSSGADLPRDIEFLFSRNRLNVAISRARCLAILVANRRLLDVECKTPEQMSLVNSMCRYREVAEELQPPRHDLSL
jgi:predicted RecB family nuclease